VDVLSWFGDRLGVHRIAVAASFADALMPALAARALPGVDVLFLDTGYHFPQTLDFRDQVAGRFGLTVRSLQAAESVPEQDRTQGADLWARAPDRCCALRRRAPMDEALRAYDAWATGLRRGDHPGRAATQMVEWDAGRGIIKVNPLVAFTDEQVAACIAEHDLPVHPLVGQGYRSIGCAPCTVPVGAEGAARDGRWPGRAKTECGLHLDLPTVAPGGSA
jgi:phosphoadenosine phosphosulfate reductase